MITYQTLGSADGTPLVFIHGLGAGKKQISSALTNLPDDPDFRALAGRNPPVAASIAPLFDSPDIAVLEKMWSDNPFDSLDSLKKSPLPHLCFPVRATTSILRRPPMPSAKSFPMSKAPSFPRATTNLNNTISN